MFACEFRRHRYARLPFCEPLADKMFQQKIDEIFRDIPYVFGITDDIQVIG